MASTHSYKISSIIILGVLLLTACGGVNPGAGQPTPTIVPIVVSSSEIVVDGRLVPREFVEIAFNTAGEVEEVLFEENDLVKAGDVIARLGNREPLEANLSNARLELLAAQQELLNAEQQKQALYDNLPQAQTDSLQALTDAREDFKDAERKVAGLRESASQPDLDEAKATLILAEDKLDKARKDYKPYENKSENNVIRAALLNRLAQAQRDFDNASRRYNNLVGGSTDFYRSQTTSEFEIAQARLEQAEKDYADLQDGPDPDQLALVEAQISTANGRIAAAESAIQAGEAALSDLDLVATIDGTLTRFDLIEGQRVTPGLPVAQLADFSEWYVETDNLTEIEVVDVYVGQNASITPDAISDLALTGVVDSIGNVFEEKRGDITYTTRILLDQVDERLRWGMTVVVDLEK
jgi:multidrug resistance efflux pump